MGSPFEHELERAGYLADAEAQFWHGIHHPAPRVMTPEEREAEYAAARHHRLLERARSLQLQADPDYCRADGCVVWSPQVAGRCEVVTRDSCSCREYRLWGHCPHHALISELTRKDGTR